MREIEEKRRGRFENRTGRANYEYIGIIRAVNCQSGFERPNIPFPGPNRFK